MLEYRVRRLPAARAAAHAAGYEGARFPWESARGGGDVTPSSARDRGGHVVPIRTGLLEEHIVADVAWAAAWYIDWTGDEAFTLGPGRELLVETARYWASRIRTERDGTAHILGVIGPDEYHEPVDDNAFTNLMARWNLRRAATAIAADGDAAETRRWLQLAEALVDGYDPDSSIYEQFAGFQKLEPLVIEEVAPRRPISADLLLGSERVRHAQIVKQADVLMAHHLVPDEMVPGSLEPNLRFYEPRTAHGSSLSPGIHAALFARARDDRHALEALRMAARIDLDDLTATTAGGLHLGAMGTVWQAVALGFAGLRPRPDGVLTVDPRLPAGWSAFELNVVFQGRRVRLRKEHDGATVWADGPVRVRAGDCEFEPTIARDQAGPARVEMGGRPMSTVLAAIDNSAAARPVLATARAVAALWYGDGRGHPRGRRWLAHRRRSRSSSGCEPARRARATWSPASLDAAAHPDVDAVVIGARGRPGGPRPAGHVAVELITLCDKPVIVVPPEASCAGQLHHLLFGLEGTTPTSEVLGPTIELARERGFEVVVVHVDDEASLPLFSDQPQHETDVFASEFLARYGPAVEPSALELRIGEPAEQVLSTCDETAADMVVLAWSCSLAPGRAGFVRHVLEQARIPVMLVPTGTR